MGQAASAAQLFQSYLQAYTGSKAAPQVLLPPFPGLFAGQVRSTYLPHVGRATIVHAGVSCRIRPRLQRVVYPDLPFGLLPFGMPNADMAAPAAHQHPKQQLAQQRPKNAVPDQVSKAASYRTKMWWGPWACAADVACLTWHQIPGAQSCPTLKPPSLH